MPQNPLPTTAARTRVPGIKSNIREVIASARTFGAFESKTRSYLQRARAASDLKEKLSLLNLARIYARECRAEYARLVDLAAAN